MNKKNEEHTVTYTWESRSGAKARDETKPSARDGFTTFVSARGDMSVTQPLRLNDSFTPG
jgi:hypothetical protein